MELALELAEKVGVSAVCKAMALPRATCCRRLSVVGAPAKS